MERKTEITIPLMQGVKASKVEIDYENNKVIAFYEEDKSFKEGDFLVHSSGNMSILSRINELECIHHFWTNFNSFKIGDNVRYSGLSHENKLATPKQKAKLLYEMNKKGYYWDAENKKVEKLEFDFEGNKVYKINDGLGIGFNDNNQILTSKKDTYEVYRNIGYTDIPYYFEQTKVEDLKDGYLFLLEDEKNGELSIKIGDNYYYINDKQCVSSFRSVSYPTVLKVMPYERD